MKQNPVPINDLVRMEGVVTVRDIDTDALLALSSTLDGKASSLVKINDLDQNRKRRSLRRAHAHDLLMASATIREALGLEP